MRAIVATAGAALALASAGSTARADHELCVPDAKHAGKVIDVAVRQADIQDVFRLLADVGKKDLVIPDDVAGKVTLKLARVTWQQAACTVAALHELRITVNGSVLLITRR